MRTAFTLIDWTADNANGGLVACGEIVVIVDDDADMGVVEFSAFDNRKPYTGVPDISACLEPEQARAIGHALIAACEKRLRERLEARLFPQDA